MNNLHIQKVPYDRPVVEFVDALIIVANKNGSKKQVETSLDWKTMAFIFSGWQVLYPKQSQEFGTHMQNWRKLSTPHGITKEKGGAMMQHIANVPEPLYNMIKVIFPNQKWDRKFMRTFAKEMPMLKGTDDTL